MKNLFLLFFVPLTSFSQLYYDGRYIGEVGTLEMSEDGKINVRGHSGSGGQTNTPPPTQQNCPATQAVLAPANMAYDLSTPGSRRTYTMDRTRPIAIPFKSGFNPNFQGQFNLIPMTGNSDVTREIWVSLCPGGDPIVPSRFCKSQAPDSINIMFSQKNETARCKLEHGKQYYLNVRNVPLADQCTKARQCDIYMQLYTKFGEQP